MKPIYIIAFIILLIVVSLPRFNWRNLPEPLNQFVGAKPFDVEQYEKYVEFFRGDISLKDELEAPFSYRPFVPFLASILPFDALTSINIINLLIISIGLIHLSLLLKHFGFDEKLISIGCLLFIFSFPLFYYTTSGYIDASVVGILLIMSFYLFTDRNVLFIISFVIGVLIKETVIVFLPVATVYFLLKKNMHKRYAKIITIIIAYLIIEAAVRYLAPQKTLYFWKPSTEILSDNLSRIKTYLSLILTMGLPFLLTILFLLSKYRSTIQREIFYSLSAGLLFSFLIWLYSVFSAYSDGRQVWISYAFTIPLSLFYLKSISENKKIR